MKRLLIVAFVLLGCSPQSEYVGPGDSPYPGKPYQPSQTNVYIYVNKDHNDVCYIWIAASYNGGGGISCVSND